MAIGGSFTSQGSKLFSEPLGVVQVGYKGFDLGLTTDATTLKPDLNTKDIIYQQKGTKAYDHVITGADWLVSCTLGEISTQMLATILDYLVTNTGNTSADAGYFKTDMYQSMLDNNAGVLRLASVTNQVASSDLEDIMNFYQAIPTINADLINWGADVQRNLPVEFRIKIKVMTTAESTIVPSAYGYFGDPTTSDLPAVVWPDRTAPYVIASDVVSATSVTVQFSENVTEISGATTVDQVVVKVDNLYIVPTASAYATDTLTLTLPASSILTTQTVELFIAGDTCEDASSNANEDVDAYSVTNEL